MKSLTTWLAALLVLALLAMAPLAANPFHKQILFLIFIYGGLGFAWNIVGGYAGQLSLGHAAYFGLGAYSYALLAPHIGVWPALAAAAALSAAGAAPIGWITFRLRGAYFILATVVVAQLLNVLATNQLKPLTQGAAGLLVKGLVTDPAAYYWVGLGFLVFTFAVQTAIATAKAGYYLMAIREDEDTAQTVTINTDAYKLLALLLSAMLTGIGGAIFAANLGSIQPGDVFGQNVSDQIVFLAILGGAGTLWGPLVGAAILELASDLLKNTLGNAGWVHDANAFAFLIYGLLIVMVVMYMPAGIVGTLINWWKGRSSRVSPGAKASA